MRATLKTAVEHTAVKEEAMLHVFEAKGGE